MNILIDTQALIWYLQGSTQLSHRASQVISAPTNSRFVSMASLWEIAIKVNLKKIQLPMPLDQFFEAVLTNGFYVLGISVIHIKQLGVLTISSNHKDPFDRLIASQCLVHAWPIVSIDTAFNQYGITRIC